MPAARSSALSSPSSGRRDIGRTIAKPTADREAFRVTK
jgi:hypothetical protein